MHLTLDLNGDISAKVLVQDEDYNEIDPEQLYQVTTINFLTKNAFDVSYIYLYTITIVLKIWLDLCDRWLLRTYYVIPTNAHVG